MDPTSLTPDQLAQLMYLQHLQLSFEYFVVSLSAIFVWEFLHLLPGEIALYRSKFSAVTALFIICRYGVLFGIIIFMYTLFNTLDPASCIHWIYIPPIMYAVVQTAASAVFVLRVVSIYNKNRIVIAGLSAGLVIMFGLGIGVTFLQKASSIQGKCVPVSGTIGSSAAYFYAVIFDIVILGLTVPRLWYSANRATRQMPLTKVLLRDGFSYFLIAFIVNLATAICILVNQNNSILQSFLLPAAFLFPALMAQKVVVNLKMWARKQQGYTTKQQNSGMNSNSTYVARVDPAKSQSQNIPMHSFLDSHISMDGKTLPSAHSLPSAHLSTRPPTRGTFSYDPYSVASGR